jgi:hypothetical protein
MDRLAVTSVTNLALGGLGLYCAGMLAGRPKARGSAAWFWSCAMLCLSAGAIVGGIDHGFVERAGLDRYPIQRANWLVMGVATFCVLMTAGRQYVSPNLQRAVLVAGLAQLAVYSIAVLTIGDFRVVVLNYAPVMLLMLALSLRGLRDGTGTWWMVAGLLVLAGASVVQLARVDVLAPLDHDGLYHLIAMPGLVLLYQAGRRLATA